MISTSVLPTVSLIIAKNEDPPAIHKSEYSIPVKTNEPDEP